MQKYSMMCYIAIIGFATEFPDQQRNSRVLDKVQTQSYT